MKKYNQAPLPFMGQKRRFISDFKSRLNECAGTKIFVDLFGGSGLLSRSVKDVYPDARVIYNDFDNYERRINAIPSTNRILKDIRKIVSGLPKDQRIPDSEKSAILKRIGREKGFVDYITLSSSLLFSMKYVLDMEGLKKETFYNVVKQSDYDSTGYLDGLEIVRLDYKKLFNKYKNWSYVTFLVDPPYLSTETGTYTGYWKLADYLDVLNVLNSHSYFYFTSNKSNILELCTWMSDNSNYKNPFENAIVSNTYNQMNHTSSYTDIMLFKGKTVG